MRPLGRLARAWSEGELARNSTWALGSAGVVAVAVFLETIILARHLGAEELGILLLVLAYPEAVQQLLDFRLRDAMTKYLAEFMTRRRYREAVALVKLLWVIDVGVALLALLIVVATAGFAADLFVAEPHTAHLMRIYAIGVFVSSLDSASGPVLRVMDRFGLAFLTGAFAYAGRLGLIVGVVALEGSLEALVWARVAGELLLALLLIGAAVLVLRPFLWTERRAPMSLLKNRSHEIRNFLLSTNLTGVVRLAATKLDTLLVGLLASPSTVSTYKVALQFSKAPLLISDSLHVAIFPAFARDFARGAVGRMREMARRSSIVVAALSLPIVLVVGLEGDTIIAALLGDSFRDAGTALLICLLGVIPQVAFFWLYPLLLTTGYASTFLKLATVATVAQLVAIVVLVPPFGAAGAAAGFALNLTMVVTLGLRVVYKQRILSEQQPA